LALAFSKHRCGTITFSEECVWLDFQLRCFCPTSCPFTIPQSVNGAGAVDEGEHLSSGRQVWYEGERCGSEACPSYPHDPKSASDRRCDHCGSMAVRRGGVNRDTWVLGLRRRRGPGHDLARSRASAGSTSVWRRAVDPDELDPGANGTPFVTSTSMKFESW
jgi:hypothetical protein